MANRLLNAGVLFQTLLHNDRPEGTTVAADLDVGAYEDVPFITHTALISQDPDGLWSVTLTINIFLEPAGAHDVASHVYATVHAWGEDPDAGIVDGVGAVESVEDLNALMPASGEVLMNNKVVRHYQGTFNLRVRSH